jgi:tetratricopeptide (TPR) repeat protein
VAAVATALASIAALISGPIRAIEEIPRNYWPDCWVGSIPSKCDPDYFIHLGDGLLSRQDFDGAIADYSAAIAAYPDRATGYIKRADANYAKPDPNYNLAINDYGKASNLDPSNIEVFNQLGAVYYDKGDLDNAIDSYSQAIRLREPSTPLNYKSWPLNNRGNAYSTKKLYDLAAADYKAATGFDGQYAEPHNGLGNVYRAQGDTSDAIAEFKKAIAIAPNFALAKKNLGEVYIIMSARD